MVQNLVLMLQIHSYYSAKYKYTEISRNIRTVKTGRYWRKISGAMCINEWLSAMSTETCMGNMRKLCKIAVSPLAGLWVETILLSLTAYNFRSAPLRGCELKRSDRSYTRKVLHSQPPCGAVSWNIQDIAISEGGYGQPPCGAVSWNNNVVIDEILQTVSPLAGLWVETSRQGHSP